MLLLHLVAPGFGRQITEIESRDTETKIHSAFTEVVGDGELIKIDRVAPADDVIESVDAYDWCHR